MANLKLQVAELQYIEDLANGMINIGSKWYEQDWNQILEHELGYQREFFTYRTELELELEDGETINTLYIYKKI